MAFADNRIEFADVLRCFATALSCFSMFPLRSRNSPAYIAIVVVGCNAVYSLARRASSCFVMISGFLLLSPARDESMSLFFASAFCGSRSRLRPGEPFTSLEDTRRVSAQAFARLARRICRGSVYYHLWFIYTIVGIYLATPVFRVYVKHAPRSNYALPSCTLVCRHCIYR